MLFNSFEYLVFLPVVFLLYWFLFNQNIKLRNLFLLTVSYIFYGWWDWRFLSLIIFSSTIDFSIGIALVKNKEKRIRKYLLLSSLIVNLGLLGVFKYYNFFIESFVESFGLFGTKINLSTINIILPVGISFYTFQTLSYTIDVYREKLKPTADLIAFFAFVCFFPQLVAGPIERAANVLPQFYERKNFEYGLAVEGMRQILWGLFKKIVVADNCAVLVNQIFENYESTSGLFLIFGAVLFAFQIYGDFSGYSDIAIGTGKLFGYKLMINFRTPYFSRDIAEFWRRWHISLSTWFRDYLYIPLGGSRSRVIRNVFIIFIVSGFWHGANWTFIIWGALNAIYFLPLLLTKKNRRYLDDLAPNTFIPSVKELWTISKTFIITCIAWIFFRAENVTQALDYFVHIYSNHFIDFTTLNLVDFFKALVFIFLLLAIEWVYRNNEFVLELSSVKSRSLRWSIYGSLCLLILIFAGSQQTFIYFQF